MPKITLGIKGLHEILGQDYGIEEPYWGQGDPYSAGAFCVQAQSNDFSTELIKTSKILVT